MRVQGPAGCARVCVWPSSACTRVPPSVCRVCAALVHTHTPRCTHTHPPLGAQERARSPSGHTRGPAPAGGQRVCTRVPGGLCTCVYTCPCVCVCVCVRGVRALVLHVCVNAHVCASVSVYIHMCAGMCMCVHACVRVCTYKFLCTRVCRRVRVCTYMCASANVCVHVCTCVCICEHLCGPVHVCTRVCIRVQVCARRSAHAWAQHPWVLPCLSFPTHSPGTWGGHRHPRSPQHHQRVPPPHPPSPPQSPPVWRELTAPLTPPPPPPPRSL